MAGLSSSSDCENQISVVDVTHMYGENVTKHVIVEQWGVVVRKRACTVETI